MTFVLFQFGGYGGFWSLAWASLVVASIVQRRYRWAWCIASWLLAIVQCLDWLFILSIASLAHSSSAAETVQRLEFIYWSGIVAGTVVTGGLS